MLLPVTGRRAFVKVKSQASLQELKDYITQYRNMDQYDEMLSIVTCSANRVARLMRSAGEGTIQAAPLAGPTGIGDIGKTFDFSGGLQPGGGSRQCAKAGSKEAEKLEDRMCSCALFYY